MPVPALGDNDVEVEVKAAGVCHSDLHPINGFQVPKIIPKTLGHEGSGVIVAAGKNVTNFVVGDRVGYDYVSSCGTCNYCTSGKENLCDSMSPSPSGGTWQERIIAPSRHVHRLPSNLGFAEGAIMNCAVMTGYHATKMAGTKLGSSVLIYGLGGVGMSLLKWTKIAGATEIIAVDRDEKRLEKATREGATITINPGDGSPADEVKRRTAGGVDIAIEVIGKHETYRNTLACVRKGGAAMFIGMNWEPFPLYVLKELQFGERRLLSPEDHSKSDIREVLHYIETGQFRFGDDVTHRFPLRDVNEAVRVLNERIGSPGRIILEP